MRSFESLPYKLFGKNFCSLEQFEKDSLVSLTLYLLQPSSNFICTDMFSLIRRPELLPVLKTPSLVFLWNREVCHGETEVHARVQA